MPPSGSRGRHGRPSLPAEQRQDQFARDGAPQTRAMDRPLWGVSASGRAGHACGSADHGLSRPGRSEGRSRRRLGSAPYVYSLRHSFSTSDLLRLVVVYE